MRANACADILTSPVKALVEGANTVSCGNDFTVWLCDGKLHAAGNPQYGQLGDGSDHEYNAKDSEWVVIKVLLVTCLQQAATNTVAGYWLPGAECMLGGQWLARPQFKLLLQSTAGMCLQSAQP